MPIKAPHQRPSIVVSFRTLLLLEARVFLNDDGLRNRRRAWYPERWRPSTVARRSAVSDRLHHGERDGSVRYLHRGTEERGLTTTVHTLFGFPLAFVRGKKKTHEIRMTSCTSLAPEEGITRNSAGGSPPRRPPSNHAPCVQAPREDPHFLSLFSLFRRVAFEG